MLEVNIRVFHGDLKGRIHVTERCGKYHIIALLSKLSDDSCCVGTLGYILYECSLNLIAESFYSSQSAAIMFEGPSRSPGIPM